MIKKFIQLIAVVLMFTSPAFAMEGYGSDDDVNPTSSSLQQESVAEIVAEDESCSSNGPVKTWAGAMIGLLTAAAGDAIYLCNIAKDADPSLGALFGVLVIGVVGGGALGYGVHKLSERENCQ